MGQWRRSLILFSRLFALANIAFIAAFGPVAVRADIIGPGGQRAKPPPMIFVVGPRVLDKIQKAGFDCAALDDVVEEGRSGVDPAMYVNQHLIPFIVTCKNGKKFFVTLPYKPEDPGGAAEPLN